jgi:hypothetical protein
MITDIFIRTYHKDIEWLKYALASIHKHVKGWRNIVITMPKGQGHLLGHLTTEKVIEVEDMQDGYIGQQLTKMEAWKYTDAECVLFWDSDVIATEPIDIHREYFKDGKPILYKTKYSSLPGCPWQGVTEKAVGFPVEWEYMRRMPLLYWTQTLEGACEDMRAIHGLGLRQYMEKQPHKAFSEFNVMGAFVDRYSKAHYAIIDTESIDMPTNKVFQGWSWGGITPEVMATINKALQ